MVLGRGLIWQGSVRCSSGVPTKLPVFPFHCGHAENWVSYPGRNLEQPKFSSRSIVTMQCHLHMQMCTYGDVLSIKLNASFLQAATACSFFFKVHSQNLLPCQGWRQGWCQTFGCEGYGLRNLTSYMASMLCLSAMNIHPMTRRVMGSK